MLSKWAKAGSSSSGEAKPDQKGPRRTARSKRKVMMVGQRRLDSMFSAPSPSPSESPPATAATRSSSSFSSSASWNQIFPRKPAKRQDQAQNVEEGEKENIETVWSEVFSSKNIACNQESSPKGMNHKIPIALKVHEKKFQEDKPECISLLCWLTGTSFCDNKVFDDDAGDSQEMELFLARDPENQFDPNAIRVFRSSKTIREPSNIDSDHEIKQERDEKVPVGFVERLTAVFFSPLWDNGYFTQVRAFAVQPDDKSKVPLMIVAKFTSRRMREAFYSHSAGSIRKEKENAEPNTRELRQPHEIQTNKRATMGFQKASTLCVKQPTSGFQKASQLTKVVAETFEPEPPLYVKEACQQLYKALCDRQWSTYKRVDNPSNATSNNEKSFVQSSLSAPLPLKKMARRTVTNGEKTIKPWNALPIELLQSIFSSAVLDVVDVNASVRLVCKDWCHAVDANGFLRFQTMYFRCLSDSPESPSFSTWALKSGWVSAVPKTIDDLAREIGRTFFRWLTVSVAKHFVAPLMDNHPEWRQVLETVLKKEEHGDVHTSDKGEEQQEIAMISAKLVLYPLLFGDQDVRSLVLSRIIPGSFQDTLSIPRHLRVDLVYLIALVLRGPHWGEGLPLNNVAGCRSWMNVCNEIEHQLFVRQAPQSLIVMPKLGSFLATKEQTRLTAEQLAVVQCNLSKGQVCVIKAMAGSGKTTTLVNYTRARPGLRFLYLSFNVSVREEASRLFPPHVKCLNIHQLAFRKVGFKYRSKLRPELSTSAIRLALSGIFHTASSLVQCPNGIVGFLPQERILGLVGDTIHYFTVSSDREILEHHASKAFEDNKDAILKALKHHSSKRNGSALSHLGVEERDNEGKDTAPEVVLLDLLQQLAKAVWSKMAQWEKPSSSSSSDSSSLLESLQDESDYLSAPMTHNGYVKLYQLSHPNLSSQFDVILLDEAQDCSPCIRDIVMNQSCARILVGDHHQSIYQFAGAEDALAVERAYPDQKYRSFRLSRCFRFGVHIARIANGILRVFKKEQRLLLGVRPAAPLATEGQCEETHVAENQEGVFFAPQVQSSQLLLRRYQQVEMGKPRKGTLAVLCRSSKALIMEAIGMASGAPHSRFGIVGGIERSGVLEVQDMCYLALGHPPDMIQSSFIRGFSSIEDLLQKIEALQLGDWVAKASVFKTFYDSNKVPHLLRACIHLPSQLQDWKEAKYILSTVHKAKGMEFDSVILHHDFVSLVELSSSGVEEARVTEAEINLLYVAVTRAKRSLVLNSQLEHVVEFRNNFLLLPELASPSVAKSSPICTRCEDDACSAPVVHDFILLHRYVGFPNMELQPVCPYCASMKNTFSCATIPAKTPRVVERVRDALRIADDYD